MSDVVSLELLLDPESEAAVRADWQRLADAGLSSLAAHTSPSNRPHLTLLARPTLAALDVSGVVARLPIPVRLGAALLFGAGDRRVLARHVVPTGDLLAVHRGVHTAAGDTEADAPHTAPGAWTPHITLARRLRLETLPQALDLLGPEIEGALVSLRRWDSASARVTVLG
ncbi:2'-5' RNA ligase family protein [Microbacterium sp. cx-55]|uniref:2'-5' RNA ligase family protein n=1 Tax=Microbacterium sp. cx-55 TaxID=2875948 RepID=UPI001CC01D26|nr:2'-5' RNA ligase family protein [Microbacterium sp. cx-55]UGB35713.1 2'-5' RNA ligase family protein [Microbacterium sp. cx-55]